MLRLVDEALAAAVTFEDFWLIYPNKRAKKEARKAWDRIPMTPELWEQIARSVALHKRSDAWRDGGGKFIPHPATWLNGERWDDEIEQVEVCQWPKCTSLGTQKHGSRDYCDRHKQAFLRGETP